MNTPKERMLNAYKGVPSDRIPVAPEFWYYYPAKTLGVSMVEFERNVPFWQALQVVFKKFGTDGWGAAFPKSLGKPGETRSVFARISEAGYRETIVTAYKGREFVTMKKYDLYEPSWTEKYIASDESELLLCLEMALYPGIKYDFYECTTGYEAVGGDYLLEMWCGVPFFDFVAQFIGFEKAIMFFIEQDEGYLESLRARYLEHIISFIRMACDETGFESFVLGCSFSCNSLIGPNMWRKWDAPFIKELARELHARGKLLHIHFHGKCMETVADFPQLGIDCVCPFERGIGGDVDGLEGLSRVRSLLGEKVTFNGNVHTVDTLIRGGPGDARREVREIKEAFNGSRRLIIGTGDQVGYETPEENIFAMVEEAKKQ